MKKSVLLLLLAAMTTTVFTSCLGGENEQTAQINATMVQLRQDISGTEITKANYRYDIDYTNLRITITIYDEDTYAAAFVLENIPLQYDTNLGYTFQATSVTPVTASGAVINDFDISNLYGEFSTPTLDLRYTINGNINVTAIPDAATYLFSDITTRAADGSTYQHEDSYVNMSYRINSDSTLVDMTLYNVRFVGEMPLIESMTFPSIEITPSPAGNSFLLSADEIIPEISNTPYPSYKVTNFSGSVNPSFSAGSFFRYENVKCSFNCMEMNVSIDANMYLPNNLGSN